MPAGAPSKLTPEKLEKAIELANLGLPLELVARGVGVHKSTFFRWINKADKFGPDSLECRLRDSINSAAVNIAKIHLHNLRQQAENGSTAAATWMLTHHPAVRDQFSDAAAERKVERRTIATVIEAITAAGLPQEDEQRLLLHMQARGLAAQQQEQDPDDQDADDQEGVEPDVMQ